MKDLFTGYNHPIVKSTNEEYFTCGFCKYMEDLPLDRQTNQVWLPMMVSCLIVIKKNIVDINYRNYKKTDDKRDKCATLWNSLNRFIDCCLRIVLLNIKQKIINEQDEQDEQILMKINNFLNKKYPGVYYVEGDEKNSVIFENFVYNNIEKLMNEIVYNNAFGIQLIKKIKYNNEDIYYLVCNLHDYGYL